tara:strand:+ start:1437 stop:1544 length:108 start_codon:yes stop_codon:yes gene_type:complete
VRRREREEREEEKKERYRLKTMKKEGWFILSEDSI